MYTSTDYNIHGTFPLLFHLPLLISLASLSNPLLLTWNPPSCDRIRPHWSQVAGKLTSPFPNPFPKPSPLQIPRTQVTLRPTKTTSRKIRRLLSRTIFILETCISPVDLHISFSIFITGNQS
jgi:hypothetical protein